MAGTSLWVYFNVVPPLVCVKVVLPPSFAPIIPLLPSLYPSFLSPPYLPLSPFPPSIGSCADIMHSALPFQNGFKEAVIAVILRDVVQGLSYLHNLGYVHR